MSVFDNLSKKVAETAKAAAKKSGGLVEITKLNVSISAEEDKIEKVYGEIGKAVYAVYAEGTPVGDYLTELCEKVKAYEESIYAMKQKIYELKNTKVCPGCAVELDADIAFCPKCGTKQEIPRVEEPVEPAEEAPAPEACTSCDAENTPETDSKPE